MNGRESSGLLRLELVCSRWGNMKCALGHRQASLGDHTHGSAEEVGTPMHIGDLGNLVSVWVWLWHLEGCRRQTPWSEQKDLGRGGHNHALLSGSQAELGLWTSWGTSPPSVLIFRLLIPWEGARKHQKIFFLQWPSSALYWKSQCHLPYKEEFHLLWQSRYWRVNLELTDDKLLIDTSILHSRGLWDCGFLLEF